MDLYMIGGGLGAGLPNKGTRVTRQQKYRPKNLKWHSLNSLYFLYIISKA